MYSPFVAIYYVIVPFISAVHNESDLRTDDGNPSIALFFIMFLQLTCKLAALLLGNN